MTNLKFFLAITFLTVIVLNSCKNNTNSSQEENSSIIKEEQAGSSTSQEKRSLFNGEDLSGWNVHGTEKWYVENGILVCESGPDEEYGYLATNEEFKDFELELDFKQVADGNSGVFFRSSLNGTKIGGWQVEIAPPGNNTGGIYESYVKGDWLAEIPEEKEDILKPGDWNHLRVRVIGDRVSTWLNGQEMADVTNELIGGEPEGVLALQIHSGGGIKVLWKNIIIEEIE